MAAASLNGVGWSLNVLLVLSYESVASLKTLWQSQVTLEVSLFGSG